MQSWCGLVTSFLWPSLQGYPMLQATYSLFPCACLLSRLTPTNTSLISCSAPSATALPTLRPSWFCVHDSVISRPPAPPGPLFLLHVHTLATSYGMATLICSRGLLPASLQLYTSYGSEFQLWHGQTSKLLCLAVASPTPSPGRSDLHPWGGAPIASWSFLGDSSSALKYHVMFYYTL